MESDRKLIVGNRDIAHDDVPSQKRLREDELATPYPSRADGVAGLYSSYSIRRVTALRRKLDIHGTRNRIEIDQRVTALMPVGEPHPDIPIVGTHGMLDEHLAVTEAQPQVTRANLAVSPVTLSW